LSRSRKALLRTRAVGVVVPVNDEEELVGAALTSLDTAIDALSTWDLETKVIIVLDACSDASARMVGDWLERLCSKCSPPTVTVTTCHVRNVGFARRLGCETLLEQWAHLNPANIWLATTDADSRVPKEWLRTQVLQHESGVDLWCGRVSVLDWSSYRRETSPGWQSEYELEPDPVHGTSLGFNANVYRKVGGFLPVRTGEDRELRRALVANGVVVNYDSSVPVVTSARRVARAPLGFANALRVFEVSEDSAR
jgi:cellulose synthase/poly-beta-1,6-N-acetylglucosamine synthase-like glycosyltransferase